MFSIDFTISTNPEIIVENAEWTRIIHSELNAVNAIATQWTRKGFYSHQNRIRRPLSAWNKPVSDLYVMMTITRQKLNQICSCTIQVYNMIHSGTPSNAITFINAHVLKEHNQMACKIRETANFITVIWCERLNLHGALTTLNHWIICLQTKFQFSHACSLHFFRS